MRTFIKIAFFVFVAGCDSGEREQADTSQVEPNTRRGREVSKCAKLTYEVGEVNLWEDDPSGGRDRKRAVAKASKGESVRVLRESREAYLVESDRGRGWVSKLQTTSIRDGVAGCD